MKSSEIVWIVFSVVLFMEPPHVIPCRVSDANIQRYQRQFEDLVSNGIGMIYVNVSSPSFVNLTLAQKEWNKIIDWIWVTDDYKHFLSYPIDIDVFTLGLIKQNVRSLKLNVSIDNIENCTSNRVWTLVCEYLFEVHNRSDGYFCHRYFENQAWKNILYTLSHASIGYGFHCFQTNDPSSPVNVEKSGVIYITIASILILSVYYPLILSPSSEEQQGDRQVSVYTKADYPYTPRRLILHLIFKNANIHRSEDATDNKKEKTLVYVVGVRVSILITLVTALPYFVKIVYIDKCSDCLPPNALIFNEVYVANGISTTILGYIIVVVSSVLGFFFLAILNTSILVLSKLSNDQFILTDFVFLRVIPVSCFLQDKNDTEGSKSISIQITNRFNLIFSLKFWCKVYLLPLSVKGSRWFLRLVFSLINFIINVFLIIFFSAFPLFNQLCILFLHSDKCSDSNICRASCPLISLLLSLFFATLLLASSLMFMGISCIVQFLIYIILVAIPHLYSTQLRIFLIATASVTYMSRFFLEFFLLYRLLLLKIIDVKNAKEIGINDFDTIVQHCCPTSKEVFFLCAKVLLTSFLLIIMYLTLNELNFLDSENSFDLNTLLMYVFVLLTPGLLEVLFFESNENKVERMHDEINEQVRKLNDSQDVEQNIHENTADNHNAELTWCEIFSLGFCDCFGSLRDKNGHYKCCYTLEEAEDENGTKYFTTTHFMLCDKGRQRGEFQSINDTEMV